VPAITVEQLLRTALRLRPDRLVVGEVRGAEVVGLVQALNTGHDGSWSTCHANSALDALHRLETLVVQAAPAWPLRAVRDHIVRCIDAVVHVERTTGGVRRVKEISEVIDRDGVAATRPIVVGGRRVADFERARVPA
jgi:pilus assembly protein CpaF